MKDTDIVAILSWSEASRIKIGLKLAFDLGTEGGSCQVAQSVPTCGDAKWIKGGGSSESIVVKRFGGGSNYAFFAQFGQRMCKSYGAPSTSAIAGGKDGFIDCVGDCSTGRGYCYATNDGKYCGSCVLWSPDPDKGEVLCSEYGMPQGQGPIPGTKRFKDNANGCNKREWRQSGEEARWSVLETCSSRTLYANARLRIVQGGVTVANYQLANTDDTIVPGNGGQDNVWLACMSPTGRSSHSGTLGLGTHATIYNRNPGIAPLLENPGMTCRQRMQPEQPWACDEEVNVEPPHWQLDARIALSGSARQPKVNPSSTISFVVINGPGGQVCLPDISYYDGPEFPYWNSGYMDGFIDPTVNSYPGSMTESYYHHQSSIRGKLFRAQQPYPPQPKSTLACDVKARLQSRLEIFRPNKQICRAPPAPQIKVRAATKEKDYKFD